MKTENLKMGCPQKDGTECEEHAEALSICRPEDVKRERRLNTEHLMEEVVSIPNMKEAMKRVRANKGAAGLQITPQVPGINTDRIKGLKEYASAAEWYDDVKASVENALVTFSQAVVDDSVKKNADFQADAGLHPRIIRRAAYGCCKWCTNLAGSYDYPEDTP